MFNFTCFGGKNETKVKSKKISYRDPDRRHYARFSPEKAIYVFHYDFGKVLDISIGGLLFIYQDDQEDWHEEQPDTGVLFFSVEDYIDGIPFTVVSDWPVSSPQWYGSSALRKRRIAFGCLTEYQTEKIERLLLNHVSMTQLREMENSFFCKPR